MISQDNPFAAPSELPYALPPFDRIADEHFLPAFEAGLAEHAAEIEEIASSAEPPTFENTIVALEKSGRLLSRVSSVFFNLAGSNANDEIQRVQAEMAPRLAAHADAINLNPALFARINSLFERRDELGLDTESLRLLERHHTDVRRAGAGLPEADQKRLRELNEQISTLSTRFQQNLLKDTNELAVVVDDVAELAGLGEDEIATAAETAGEEGKYVLKLTLPTAQAALASLEDRALRERIFTASVSRGNRGNEFDNNEVVAQLVRLRAERAAVLGFPTTPRTSSRTRPRRPPRPQSVSWSGSRPSRSPTPRRRPKNCSGTSKPTSPARSCGRGTGRSTPNASARTGSRSTPPRCARTSS